MKGTVLGVTLGELGILAAFVLLYLLAYDDSANTVSQARYDSLLVEMQKVEGKVDSLRSIADSLKGLRSPAAPSCRSAGLTDSYLFSATVEGPDVYVIEDSTYSLQEIRQRYDDALAAADSAGCVHQVDVRPKPNQSSSVFVSAGNRLRKLFYVRVLSAR